ncbi:hypothetical protein RFY41_00200 [Acinetobacter soli]|nr:hypothetical protein [Acinetobacter soli]
MSADPMSITPQFFFDNKRLESFEINQYIAKKICSPCSLLQETFPKVWELLLRVLYKNPILLLMRYWQFQITARI